MSGSAVVRFINVKHELTIHWMRMNEHEHAGHMLAHAKQGNTGMNTYEHAEFMVGHAKQINTVLFFDIIANVAPARLQISRR